MQPGLDDPAENLFFEIFFVISALCQTREHRTECAAFLKTLRCYHEKALVQEQKTFLVPLWLIHCSFYQIYKRHFCL